MNYPHPIIAREGWPFLALSIIAAILVHYFAGKWAAFPVWIWALFVLQFFRDPQRMPASTDANAVISPADGRVIVVEETTDPYRNIPALKISVFMNVFNAHSQRSPVSGTVNEIRYFPGAFVNAALSKASLENERNAMLMKTDTGAEVTVVQIAGLIARRILCYAKVGDHLSVGQRYGFIRFGSRLDVYLPPGSAAQVSLGDKVYAGQTVLADLAAK
jgi:phosphatidylserine decarboxylase